VIRGQIANAKKGNSNGAPPRYGMDRVLVDPLGKIVRRLAKGETVRMPGHCVRHVPTEDKEKLEVIRYMFNRFASTNTSYNALARELESKGYPGPSGNGWPQATVAAILRNPIYCGIARWGADTDARYCTNHSDEIVPVGNGNGHKTPEDAIEVSMGHKGIISPKLFDQVQRKAAKRSFKRTTTRITYPLSGIIHCSHCGQPMYGSAIRRKDRHGVARYDYASYLCSSYNAGGYRNPHNCGHFRIDAAKVQGWLVRALQKVFLGPGRDALVAEIQKELKSTMKTSKSDGERLAKRLIEVEAEIPLEVEAEIPRIVRAIRVTDAPELIHELTNARSERDRLKAELSRIASYEAPGDVQSEAERIANTMWELGERLSDADPGTLKELFQRMVSRIDCEWTKLPRQNGRTPCKLVGGKVFLHPSPLFDCLSGGADYGETR